MLPTLTRVLALLCLFLHASPGCAQGISPAELVLPPSEPKTVVPGLTAESGSARARQGRRVPISVSVAADSHRRDLTLYVDRGLNPILGPDEALGAGGYRPLCVAPCEFQLRNGQYTFAVALGDTSQSFDPNKLLKVKPQLAVNHGDHLVLRHRSRLAVRLTGWLLLAAMVGGGVAIALHGEEDGGGVDYPGRAAGGVLMSSLGAVGSILLAVWPDRVTGRVER